MSLAPTPRRAPALWRATLTLLAGGVLAQALPLALGPWLTRLYTPVDFGHATLFAAVAANIAAVGCARYEFALPLAQGDDEARDLLALCLRAALLVTVATALAALVLNAAGVLAHALWLPLAVPLLAAVQALTQWGSRAQRFGALSSARVTQYGGGAAVQAAAGVAPAAAATARQPAPACASPGAPQRAPAQNRFARVAGTAPATPRRPPAWRRQGHWV